MAAVTQIRHKHSDGRTYYERKIAEGKTHNEALRALKRRVSDAIHAALVADARQAGAVSEGPGGQPGTTLSPGRPAHTPSADSSDKPLQGLTPPYGRQPRSRPRPAHWPWINGSLAGHWPSEAAGGGRRPSGHHAPLPMPGAAADSTSRVPPIRKRRPEAISKKSGETPYNKWGLVMVSYGARDLCCSRRA
jgi:hypothetical protein